MGCVCLQTYIVINGVEVGVVDRINHVYAFIQKHSYSFYSCDHMIGDEVKIIMNFLRSSFRKAGFYFNTYKVKQTKMKVKRLTKSIVGYKYAHMAWKAL